MLSIAVAPVTRAIERLGGRPRLRLAAGSNEPVATDQGNLILDARFSSIPDPTELERTLNNIPGVLDNGLFVGLADRALIAELRDGVPSVRTLTAR